MIHVAVRARISLIHKTRLWCQHQFRDERFRGVVGNESCWLPVSGWP